MANTSKPKVIASFDVASLERGSITHGLSVSDDGNRMYGVLLGGPGGYASRIVEPDKLNNGFAIFDTSDVQKRAPGAQIKLISATYYQDGSTAQHTIPIKVAGKSYLVMVDEGGSAGLGSAEGAKVACSANMTPFPMARIYDISDEKNPRLTSKLMLETHDPKNCDQILPDVAGLSIFTYGSHYCSVDNRANATALACSYFNSGIRVFDIRNPAQPKEIAYYNPPSAPTAQAGSSHAIFGQWKAGGPDWCASRLDFDYATRQLVTMCQDNGLQVMQFAPGTWPFAESMPSADRNFN